MSRERTYSDTARALASRDSDSDTEATSPLNSARPWHRRNNSASAAADLAPPSRYRRWRGGAERLQHRGLKFWQRLTPKQRAAIVIVDVVLVVVTVLAVAYNKKILAAFAPAAAKWRAMKGGWALLWILTFAVSFPPLIGYSTCLTVAGFVYGMKGWLTIATATVAGSTCAFVLSRTVLKSYVTRMTGNNKEFAALSLVLKHDGLKLLIMMRLCPLPYSLSNGAISTIPTVTWPNFMLATAVSTPKLLLHVFVGSKMADLAKKDDQTKIISYISIFVGVALGIWTGYFIYTRTKARAAELSAEEEANARRGSRASELGDDYIDDPVEREQLDVLRRDDDDMSLHQTYDADLEDGRYSDDAERRDDDDVFDIGAGEEDDSDREEPTKPKPKR